MNGTCNSKIFLVPAPLGLEEGPKGQISLNLNYKVDFHSVPWVMPQGLGLGVAGRSKI